jgi:hypothetical protein
VPGWQSVKIVLVNKHRKISRFLARLIRNVTHIQYPGFSKVSSNELHPAQVPLQKQTGLWSLQAGYSEINLNQKENVSGS